MFPGNPRNRRRNPGIKRGRDLQNKMGILVKQRNPQNYVPYVINMADPKQPTILGIVGNMIKMVLLRRISRTSPLNPRNPTVGLIRQLQIISRK
jgi:hypothetical protein